MGLYRRKWRKKDGKVLKAPIWWMAASVDGRQRFRSTGTNNKRTAQQIFDVWRSDIVRGQHRLLRKSPGLKNWAEQYLKSIEHPNTRRRYASSKENLVSFFGEETHLDHISSGRIEEFKSARRADGVKAGTLNRDLRFLAQILKQAEREMYLARSPFDLTKFFLNESRDRRTPHILTEAEQQKILTVARPRIRILTILGVETGMRTGEMLRLRWEDINFLENILQVKQSKTRAGIRAVPISAECRAELLAWRKLVGPSGWVFPSFSNRRHRLQGGRKAWASTLKQAGIPFFPIYYLRHAFATRLTACGVSPLTIAQMLGHSSTQIVPRYAQVLDQNRVDAMKKLEAYRAMSFTEQATTDLRPGLQPN